MDVLQRPILLHREGTFAASRRSNCYIATNQKLGYSMDEC